MSLYNNGATTKREKIGLRISCRKIGREALSHIERRKK